MNALISELLIKVLGYAVGNSKKGYVIRILIVALISGSMMLNPKETLNEIFKQNENYSDIKKELERSLIQTNIWYGKRPPEYYAETGKVIQSSYFK